MSNKKLLSKEDLIEINQSLKVAIYILIAMSSITLTYLFGDGNRYSWLGIIEVLIVCFLIVYIFKLNKNFINGLSVLKKYYKQMIVNLFLVSILLYFGALNNYISYDGNFYIAFIVFVLLQIFTFLIVFINTKINKCNKFKVVIYAFNFIVIIYTLFLTSESMDYKSTLAYIGGVVIYNIIQIFRLRLINDMNSIRED